MLATYMSVFIFWRAYPSRVSFLLVGTAAVLGLVGGMVRAKAGGYFLNRVDFSVHVLVIADLVFETLSFEAFRLFQPQAVVEQFHNNTNFLGCSLAFTLIIGVHRWIAMSQGKIPLVHQNVLADGAAYDQTGI